MKIIADVGGSRGRWVIVDKTIVKTIETDGFNPYTYKISSLNKILEIIKSSVESIELNKIIYYGAGINNLETRNVVEKSIKNYKSIVGYFNITEKKSLKTKELKPEIRVYDKPFTITYEASINSNLL